MGGLGSGPRCGIDGLGQYKTHGTVQSVRDGLWRPGGAFFQIGLGCVMSHHQSPHRRALHIPVLILAGKFKMEFLPTVSHWKGFPVAQICPNSHKIVSSSNRAFLSHRFVRTCIKWFPAALEHFLSHRFVQTRIKLFPAMKEHYLLHIFVQTHIELFPVA